MLSVLSSNIKIARFIQFLTFSYGQDTYPDSNPEPKLFPGNKLFRFHNTAFEKRSCHLHICPLVGWWEPLQERRP
jgi:hypothetical protein